eukprot:193111-Chlamydomonas_euryale.AAC.2
MRNGEEGHIDPCLAPESASARAGRVKGEETKRPVPLLWRTRFAHACCTQALGQACAAPC